MNRREFLESSVALTWLGATSNTQAAVAGERRLAFRLEETVGLRRFGYPVTTELPADFAGNSFRLTKDGREVPAQFRRKLPVVLDFNASPGPFEIQNYVIIANDDYRPTPE